MSEWLTINLLIMVDLEIVARLQRGRLLLWYFVCTHCKPLIISRFEFFFFIKCVFRPKTSLITLLAPRRKSKWYINLMIFVVIQKGNSYGCPNQKFYISTEEQHPVIVRFHVKASLFFRVKWNDFFLSQKTYFT